MRGRVAVVTDSTAYLADGMIGEYGLTVVPLHVVVDGRALPESSIGSEEVLEGLRRRRTVTTSRPAPAVFAEVYRGLAAEGATAVVSVHLSGEISGTVSAARVAAEEVRQEIPVHVLDSRTVTMALGYCVLSAAHVAAAGGTVAAVVAAADARIAVVRGWLYVDTLEYLRRGGRVGAAQALLGAALAVKPLLQLVDGRLELMERVRTPSRALTRLEEVVLAAAGAREVDVAVHHFAAPERAERVADRLEASIPGLRRLHATEVGAVIGAHTGPGMVAVVLAPVLPTD